MEMFIGLLTEDHGLAILERDTCEIIEVEGGIFVVDGLGWVVMTRAFA